MTDTQSWYYAEGEQTFGPVPELDVEALIQQSVIIPLTWMLAEGSENWMLAQDTPFAPHFENAQPVVQGRDQAAAAPDGLRGSLPSPDQHEQPPERLSSKFSQLGLAVLSEIKRSARLASIKAVIEKLKHVDLTNAHYALGKKAYELKADPDRLSDQYRVISVLEETIRTKKERYAPNATDTLLNYFGVAAVNINSALKVDALEVRRCIIKIGKEYRPSPVLIAVENERAAVAVIAANIEKLESEYASVVSDRISSSAFFDRRFASIHKAQLAALIVMIVLGCVIVVRVASKRHHNAAKDPEQQFLQFQTMVNKVAAPATDTVGQLKSGMSIPETLAALKTVEITNSSPYASAFQALLQQYSYDRKLETGDNLKSLLLRRPEEMPSEISCMAVSFFNGGLFRVIYIYNQQEIETIVPKQQRYAGDGDKWRVEELKDRWDALVNRTVAAAAQKYTPVTLKFVNFFDASRDPEMLSLHGDYAETVLFHGASKSAVAHIAYLTQGKTNIGLLDPDSTITTFYEERVIVATFLFLDFAREHGLSYYNAKVKVLQKQDEEERAWKANSRQKMIDQDAREHLRAAEEEKRKREQLGKNF